MSSNRQQCQSNVWHVEATFDFVAKNGNNVEQVYRKISSFRQIRMLVRYCCRFWQQWNGLNEFFVKFRLFDKVETNWTCSISFNFVRPVERPIFRSTLLPKTVTPQQSKQLSTLSKRQATFDFVERIIQLVAFDCVLSTLLLVLTGLIKHYSAAKRATLSSVRSCHLAKYSTHGINLTLWSLYINYTNGNKCKFK